MNHWIFLFLQQLNDPNFKGVEFDSFLGSVAIKQLEGNSDE